jgi:cytochrome c peroxidase
MSCGTCHVNGASNPKFFIPGISTRPGNFDTTSLTFNPKAFNSLLDPVRIPSLRGARFLAPYGHDGRSFSLRDFVHNVIVNEFAGPEPAPMILDALVAYITDIDFLPNPRIATGGGLAPQASDSERRGETLFFKPFRHQPSLSCATCHVPTGSFADQLRHDVGSGGLEKTPTLLNANFNAPYFHDGRYDSYEQVVAHFDRVFDLGLSATDTQDMVAYLNAVGDGERPIERDGVAIRMKEVRELASILQGRRAGAACRARGSEGIGADFAPHRNGRCRRPPRRGRRRISDVQPTGHVRHSPHPEKSRALVAIQCQRARRALPCPCKDPWIRQQTNAVK